MSGKHAADKAILGRKDQIRSATKLTAWLKQKYGIRMQDVIGHAMANDSPKFKDLEGWKNDHVDWLGGDVRKFRKIVTERDPQAPVSGARRKSRPHGLPDALQLTEPRRNFGPVLAAIVVAMVFQLAAPTGDASRFIAIVLQSAVIVLALRAAGLPPAHRPRGRGDARRARRRRRRRPLRDQRHRARPRPGC